MARERTLEETYQLVREVDKLRAGGMQVGEAMANVGIPSPTYYKSRVKMKEKGLLDASEKPREKRAYRKRAPVSFVVGASEEPASQKLAVVFGSAKDIAEIIRTMGM